MTQDKGQEAGLKALLTVVALLLAVAASGCGGDDTPKDTPDSLPKVQKWQESTGIACAQVDVYTGQEGNADNTSGNVCRVTVNGQECVAILPDDETAGDYPDNLIHCPKGGKDA